MGRDPLVALDELVALASVETPLARQRLEALPLRVVSEHIRVQVHAREPKVIAMSTPDFAMLTPDDLVTGEAVALDLPPATVGRPDGLGPDRRRRRCWSIAICVFFLTFVATANTDGALQHVALVGSFIVVFLVYPTTMETVTRGKSFGKLAFGLRVVRDDGGTVNAQQSFVRALIGIVEIYALYGGPAFFCCLISARGKRIGDHAAGTYVVRDRVRLTLPAPAPMPVALAAWAAAGGRRDTAGRPHPGGAAVPRPASGARRRVPRPARRDAGDPDGGRTSRRHRRPAPPRGTSSRR